MHLLLENQETAIDLVVFDCDGVLLNTMPAKIQAYVDWFPRELEAHREAFMSAVMNGFGLSRTYHVRHLYEDLAGRTVECAFLDAEVQRFTDICEPLCAVAGWLPGAKEFVEACGRAGALRYVLSGTPQEPLEDMLAHAGGTPLFDQIIGSPPTKPVSLAAIVEQTGTPADRTVFIGDANADQVAALEVGTHFVYVPSEANPPREATPTVVNDLTQLLV